MRRLITTSKNNLTEMHLSLPMPLDSLSVPLLSWLTHPVFPYIGSAEDGKLKTMAVYPGLTVQYSADGLTWKNVTSDTTVKGKIKLRTRYVGLVQRHSQIAIGRRTGYVIRIKEQRPILQLQVKMKLELTLL